MKSEFFSALMGIHTLTMNVISSGAGHEFRRELWMCEANELQSKLMGFWTVSIVRDSKRLETTMFRKLDLFPSSGAGGGHLLNWIP
jgi:hypothetical protein